MQVDTARQGQTKGQQIIRSMVIQDVEIKRWSPVVALMGRLLAAEGHEPSLVLLFRFGAPDVSEDWLADAILCNWRVRANARTIRAANASKSTTATTQNLHRWAEETRAIAGEIRAVFGDRIADVLMTAATEVDDAPAWVASRIEKVPGTPKGLAELFVSIEHWAFDQVRAAMVAAAPDLEKRLPGKDRSRTMFVAPALEELADESPISSDDALRMKVKRLRVRPGQEDNLVADVLAACTSGPFDPSGNKTP